MKTFFTKMLYAYTLTYAPGGVDKVKQRYQDKQLSGIFAHQRNMQFFSSPLTMITSFLGLPNYDRGEGQSFGNILKNIVGWEDEPNSKYDPLRTKRITLNLFRIIPYAGFNLARALPITALNILRIGTELIPTGLVVINDTIAANCLRAKKSPSTNTVVKGLATVGYPLAYGVKKVFELVANLGHWLTSPLTSISRAHRDSKNSVDIKGIKSALSEAKHEVKLYEEKKKQVKAKINSEDLLEQKRFEMRNKFSEKLTSIKKNLENSKEEVVHYEKKLKNARQAAVLKTVGKAAIRSPLLIITAPVLAPVWNMSIAAESINPNRFFSFKKPVKQPADEPKASNKKQSSK